MSRSGTTARLQGRTRTVVRAPVAERTSLGGGGDINPNNLVAVGLSEDDKVGIGARRDASPQHNVVALVERADAHLLVGASEEGLVPPRLRRAV